MLVNTMNLYTSILDFLCVPINSDVSRFETVNKLWFLLHVSVSLIAHVLLPIGTRKRIPFVIIQNQRCSKYQNGHIFYRHVLLESHRVFGLWSQHKRKEGKVSQFPLFTEIIFELCIFKNQTFSKIVHLKIILKAYLLHYHQYISGVSHESFFRDFTLNLTWKLYMYSKYVT